MINVTDLTKYSFCPFAFYVEAILKVKVSPTSKMMKGTIRHKIEEIIARKNEGIMTLIGPHMSEKEISEVLYENWRRVIKREVLRKKEQLEKGGEDYISFIKDLKHFFRNEAIIRGIKLKSILERGEIRLYDTLVEEKIEDLKLDLCGIIDRIEITEGHHVPVEIKTGFPHIHETHRLQLAAYVMLCERRFVEEIPFGFLFFTALDEKMPIFVTEEMKKKVFETKEEVKKVLEGFIPEKIRRENCEECKYFNYCFGEQ